MDCGNDLNTSYLLHHSGIHDMSIQLLVVVCICKEAVGRGKKANTCMSSDAPTTLNTHYRAHTTTQSDVFSGLAAMTTKSQ